MVAELSIVSLVVVSTCVPQTSKVKTVSDKIFQVWRAFKHLSYNLDPRETAGGVQPMS